ncbi:MAG: sensor histidine kinase [Rhodopirellula sp. JB044]|uniref:sensor histidine kinase n=1 Tax=Rhodopirellula sp. JB044 TaxID=3342844 RepID=UPI00370B60F5
MAAEIHDGLLPYLYATAAKVSALRRSADVRGSSLEKSLGEVAEWIDQSRDVARRLMNGASYPPEAVDNPLRAAKRFLDDVLSDTDTPHPPKILWPPEVLAPALPENDDSPFRLPKETAVSVYRLTIEFVRNAVRHADAKLVEVSVKDLDDDLLISVEDDGTGYDPDDLSPEKVHGLSLAHHRAAAGGIELKTDSCRQPGSNRSSGTCVTMRVKH